MELLQVTAQFKPLCLLIAAVIGLAAAPMAQGQNAVTLKITLLVPATDDRLQRSRLERAAPGHATGPVADALKVALAEGQVQLDTVGIKLQLQVAEVADVQSARQAAAATQSAGAVAVLTDLPEAATLAVADAVKLPVLNTSHTADSLRQAQCRRNLFHVAPSERMKADALAQFLMSRKWQQVLLLSGSSAEDAARSATAQAAIKRFGLKLVANKPFKLSADPRERDLANPLLLTGPSVGAHDVVWVVDSEAEFAMLLPFRTALPRPVVGDAGLAALAWSPKFERYGAPQVTRRLSKAVGRPMSAHDWPAWLAGKAIVDAALATAQNKSKGAPAAFAKALAEGELDGSKGMLMSFRPWDGQLRQPLMLSDGHGVAALAPVEGVLHPKNNLDTLGADAPEKLCPSR